jgi:hypothetical protein
MNEHETTAPPSPTVAGHVERQVRLDPERAAFEAWMRQPVAAGEDPAPWVDGLAAEAAWQAWKRRGAEVALLRAALAQSCDEHRSNIYEAGPGGGCPLLVDAVAEERNRPRQVLAYMATSREGTVRFTDNPDAARELDGYGWAITPLAGAGPNARFSGGRRPSAGTDS